MDDKARDTATRQSLTWHYTTGRVMKIFTPEEELAYFLKDARINPWQREYRFAPPRRWRFDFAWPELALALEVEGGIWIQGRHTRPTGFAKDLEKYNTATLLGWRLLRVTPEMVQDGSAVTFVKKAIEAHSRYL